MTQFCLRSLNCLLVCASAAVMVVAAPGEEKSATKTEAPAGETVDVFEAMKNGQIDVKFIAMSPTKANLVVENKTKKPLTITLPEAVAGMPVLGQLDGGQGVGAPGGGPFNIAPERTKKVELPCVCLEHGKADPYAKMKYELKPISAISDKPEVSAMLVRYGKGDISKQGAQAAAWHLQNGMSWKELAGKQLVDPRGSKSPYFSKKEIAEGMRLAEHAVAHAKDYATDKESYESYSPGAAK
jgi:hypothetical protein